MSKLKAFFEEKGFKVKEYEEEGKYKMLIRIHGSFKTISVTVEGSPQNFTVEGAFVEGQPLYGFTYVFGGGLLLLQDLKLREKLQKLEKEFLQYVTNTVIRMAGHVQNAET